MFLQKSLKIAGLASTAGYFFAKGAFNSASTVGF